MLKSSIESDDANDLDPITQACLKVYPDQTNVLQAVSKIQYWQNGPDPLDFISIYLNHDSTQGRENSYFHYVSMGLSDLYGDERVFKHSKIKEEDQISGYGFELTIKVKISQSCDIKNPPTWPFKLMQGIARYIYNGGAPLGVGDHIPSVFQEEGCKIRHLLVNEDCTLKPILTKFGSVKFFQLVGCTNDELKMAQEWSGKKILGLMKQFRELGHTNLFTDLDRAQSIFELKPSLLSDLQHSIKNEGSDLSFVKSNCFWTLEDLNETDDSLETEFKSFNRINLHLDLKSAKLLPIILKQRLDKYHSFIFNGAENKNLILIPTNFSNDEACVNTRHSLKSNGIECQILLTKKSIYSLKSFFDAISLEKKDLEDLPINEKFYFEQKQNKSLVFNLKICPLKESNKNV